MTDVTNATSATAVVNGLVSIVENAIGSTESAKTKTSLRLVATIVGGIGEEAATLLAAKYDTAAILAGVQRVENGLADMEGGVEDVVAAIKTKKSTTTAQVNSAA